MPRGDMKGEARSARCGKNLTDDDIRVIRDLPGPICTIAQQFGISIPMVSMIRNRKRWAHVKSASVWIGK